MGLVFKPPILTEPFGADVAKSFPASSGTSLASACVVAWSGASTALAVGISVVFLPYKKMMMLQVVFAVREDDVTRKYFWTCVNASTEDLNQHRLTFEWQVVQ